MIALLAFFLLLDLALLYHLFQQAFVARSNMRRKYKPWFVVVLLFTVTALFFAGSNLSLACLLAGLPAGLLVLFFLGMGVAIFRHKGP